MQFTFKWQEYLFKKCYPYCIYNEVVIINIPLKPSFRNMGLLICSSNATTSSNVSSLTEMYLCQGVCCGRQDVGAKRRTNLKQQLLLLGILFHRKKLPKKQTKTLNI